MAVLSVRDLTVEYPTEAGLVRAVNGVDFDLAAGEILGLVGESGSGKSATALAVMGLIAPPGRVAGSVAFEGRELVGAGAEAMRAIRGAGIAMVHQEPMTSLNPLMSVGTQLTEGMRAHLDLSRRAASARAAELLARVGISEPERRLRQYPHEFSGGMRQRVVIAMALACEPKVIVADEPTTALDVTIQAQILDLLQGLAREYGVAVLLITHNLGVVARYAGAVRVMYAGRIVEAAATAEIFAEPRHPYTRGLIASAPRLDAARDQALPAIPGRPPDPTRLPEGCAFAPRCASVGPDCAVAPALTTGEHRVACHRA